MSMTLDFSNGMVTGSGSDPAQFDRKTDHWYERKFLEYEGAPINFGNNSLIVKIQNEQGFKDVLTDQIAIQSLDYILNANEKLSLHLQTIHSRGN